MPRHSERDDVGCPVMLQVLAIQASHRRWTDERYRHHRISNLLFLERGLDERPDSGFRDGKPSYRRGDLHYNPRLFQVLVAGVFRVRLDDLAHEPVAYDV